ncbi:hypothetical protein [Lysobacter firmicutimachus]|uniref:Uncharacterized protein n=1 Tax=Lysobacter firmicutimachus TaxID=1792846 RepID=A0ABU8CY79_9GAMM
MAAMEMGMGDAAFASGIAIPAAIGGSKVVAGVSDDLVKRAAQAADDLAREIEGITQGGTALVTRAGNATFEVGKAMDDLSATEQQGLRILLALGYDVHVPLEASKRGVSGMPTSEFVVEGLGRVDVYAPEKPSVIAIAREVEAKVFSGQADSVVVVVPVGFSNFDMYKAAAAAFMKVRQGRQIPLDRLIFSQRGRVVQFDRMVVENLLRR